MERSKDIGGTPLADAVLLDPCRAAVTPLGGAAQTPATCRANPFPQVNDFSGTYIFQIVTDMRKFAQAAILPRTQRQAAAAPLAFAAPA
jgi:hypothetical protein